MRYYTILSCLILALHFNCRAQGGLVFKSYDTNQDERTSLTIPSDDHKLKIDKYLSVAFDVVVRNGPDHFGYVGRIIVGAQTSIDVMLNNPIDEDPYMCCLIKDKNILHKMQQQGHPINVNKWNRIKIELLACGDSLLIKENSKQIATILLPEQRSVKICFGANSQQMFSTTDVAPIILKNIDIEFNPGKSKYFWELYYPVHGTVIYDKAGRIGAEIRNQDWNIFKHTNWNKLRTIRFKSKTFPVKMPDNRNIIFVTANCIYIYDTREDKLKDYPFSPSLPVTKLSGQFLYDKFHNSLVFYDFEQQDDKIISTFNFDKKKWTIPIVRERQPVNSHNNGFVSPIDSSVIQLFGYGFHKYRRQLNRITPQSEVSSMELETITPRYMSAIGLVDSVVYIYGGMGNELGKQEYGTQLYNDLYKLRLSDMSVVKLWEKEPSQANEIVAATLIIDNDAKHAKGLFFSPRNSNSSLMLKQMNLIDGELLALADTIPYHFRDTESSADLMFDEQAQQYYMLTVNRVNNGTDYQANIYNIASPVLPMPQIEQTSNKLPYKIVGLLVVALSVAGLMLRQQKKRRLPEKSPEHESLQQIKSELTEHIITTDEPVKPGIYLINGFRIIDKQNQEITGEFTPIMCQLLSLIILYTQHNGKGVSNIKLKEFLWFDKSEESSRNNRSVHISKIRLLLENVGDFEISSTNGNWDIKLGENSYCDYMFVNDFIKRSKNLTSIDNDYISKMLEIASWGNLLPGMQYDWLDGFKADYSDALINHMVYLRDSDLTDKNYKLKILLCDGVLQFDSLDETSICVKCRSLFALKRVGTARSTFDLYAKEYEQMMGQKPDITFDSIIRSPKNGQ